MNNTMDLKIKYNSLLQRIKKGEIFLDDPSIPLPEREKLTPAFIALTRQAGAVLQQINKSGECYSQEEFDRGFLFESFRYKDNAITNIALPLTNWKQ